MLELEKKLNYTFRDRKLLSEALSHSSYANEHRAAGIRSNERLEFLGDSVLGFVTAEFLFVQHPDLPEGDLTRIRAALVCEQSLYEVAQKLGLGKYLKLGRGEEAGGGRERTSILADATEAVIGAIYLDGGYEEVSRFVLREFGYLIDQALNGRLFSDYKTEVQEILQQGGAEPQIEYKVTKESGPDHDKTFYVDLIVNGECCGSGVGKTKKEAEQNAARASLEKGKREHVL